MPKTSPVWLNGQGACGMYCTLPKSPLPGPNFLRAYSEGLQDGRWKLEIAAYFDDLPPAAGGLTLWPGSHTRIWNHQVKLSDGSNPRFQGYNDPPIPDIKADTLPVVTYCPVGSVVLWHANMLHMARQKTSHDVIRQATIYAYLKTREPVSDELVAAAPSGDIWRDWSEGIRSVVAELVGGVTSARDLGHGSPCEVVA